MEVCGALAQTMSNLWLALALYSVGLSIYAARRRSELRERFNIAGALPHPMHARRHARARAHTHTHTESTALHVSVSYHHDMFNLAL